MVPVPVMILFRAYLKTKKGTFQIHFQYLDVKKPPSPHCLILIDFKK